MLGLDNPLHIAIVLIVVLLVFGAKRLPEMGKSMGEGLRGFKASVSGESSPDRMTVSDVTSDVTSDGTEQEHVLSGESIPAPRIPAEPVA